MRQILIALGLVLGLATAAQAVTSEQVNTTSAQTLILKTLTAPVVTDPTITGTVAGSASFTAVTLTSPTLTGAIGGSASWDSPGTIGAGTAASGRFSTLIATTYITVGTPTLKSGTGSPEGVITSTIGSQYLRTDGGAGTTLYIKESGVGNTGWVAVASGGSVTWTAPGTIGSVTPNTGAFTTLSVTGQFTSTLSTGTAPMIVSSTTKVANLNVDLLDGGDWASPPSIGNTTPGAGNFSSVQVNGTVTMGTSKFVSGSGSPEGVTTAPVGSLYLRTDGGVGTTLYSKEAGAGNAGWAALTTINTVLNWGVPGTIGSTTPNTGVFTSIAWTRHRGTIVAPTYGASITIDMTLGDWFNVTATNATAFTISNPSGATAATGDEIEITVVNSSGGAITMTTPFDTLYKLASFTKPANGFNRTVRFKYTGSVWREVSCGPEVPN